MARALKALATGALICAVASFAAAGEGADASVRLHRDPSTGRLTDRPPPGAQALPSSAAESTSHHGLTPEPAPGGGRMIRLRGRFRSTTTLHAEQGGGSVEAECRNGSGQK